ncbi:MAG TPA: AzlC family ABC transporter permease, partial [Actinopolymorphaceae bacterium]|nr:AzlC family ABC transporter permease [Actinopolymorphaceae bacterium]
SRRTHEVADSPDVSRSPKVAPSPEVARSPEMADSPNVADSPDLEEDSASAHSRRSVIRDALAIGLATGAYGTSFGAIGVASGLSVAQTCALSLLAFTGASQFAFVGVVGGGGALASAGLTALMLGIRNAFYGIRLADLLRFRGVRRLGAAQFVIDETTAMTVGRPTHALARLGFWSTGLILFSLWNAGTLVGAVGGAALGDPRTFGLDAAAPAAFVALLWPQLTGRRSRLVAAAAAVIALALVPLVPPGVPVLVAGGIAIAVGLRRTTTDKSRGHRPAGSAP